MPGLSLWLVPHADNPFTKTTQELISDTVPRNFVSNDKILSFPPHVTITSDVDESVVGNDPQTWLASLTLPDFKKELNEVVVELDTLEAEDPFFRKMNIAISENANLRKLAAAVRSQAAGDASAEAWAQKEYRPHLSLFYGDTATSEVKGKIPLIEMKIGFAFGDLFACCGGALCFGGEMMVVDTRKEVGEWKNAVLGRRDTEWVCWRASRNLI